jgi:hypothetical protein
VPLPVAAGTAVGLSCKSQLRVPLRCFGTHYLLPDCDMFDQTLCVNQWMVMMMLRVRERK